MLTCCMHISCIILKIQWNLSNHPPNKGQLLYNGQSPRSHMNSLCTKQPLNKGHACTYHCIKAKTLFPNGVRYRGVPL